MLAETLNRHATLDGMKIEYDRGGGTEVFDLDLSEIDLGEAMAIKRQLGLTLVGLETGMGEGDPAALQAVFWIMLRHAGEKVALDRVDFKPVKFAMAIQAAAAAELAADSEPAEEGPKDEPAVRSAPKRRASSTATSPG